MCLIIVHILFTLLTSTQYSQPKLDFNMINPKSGSEKVYFVRVWSDKSILTRKIIADSLGYLLSRNPKIKIDFNVRIVRDSLVIHNDSIFALSIANRYKSQIQNKKTKNRIIASSGSNIYLNKRQCDSLLDGGTSGFKYTITVK